MTSSYSAAAELIRKKDYEAAQTLLDAALDKNPGDAAALSLMTDAYAGQNNTHQATRYALLSFEADGTAEAKKKFLRIAGKTLYNRYDQAMARAVMSCLNTPEVEFEGASMLWASLLVAEPAFRKIYWRVYWKSAWRRKILPWMRNPFGGIKDFAPLLSPYFLQGLKKSVVYSLQFEQFITVLREFLLEREGAPPSSLPATDYLRLAAAVAGYDFHTDYILDVAPREQAKVDALRTRIENSAPKASDAAAVALLACYTPLYSLQNAEEIARVFAQTPHMREVTDEQVMQYFTNEKRAATVAALTPVTDALSVKVKEQYETFPYPRWRELGEQTLPWTEKEKECLAAPGATALIAGCGTGREACGLALTMPDAEILAVDISRASLAYAAGMAEKLGARNVRFGQADILNLDALGRTFDYVQCFGVLHHMQEPEKAWEILTRRAKPGGTLYVGLYSKAARHAIAAARAAITQGGYAPTAEGMRRFRKRSPKLLRKPDMAVLLRATDYFSLNMYRDLVFHEHEDPFDIPRIKAALKNLGLVFEGFRLPENVLARYRQQFPDDAAVTNLDNWHAFEQANPYTFIKCYGFRCRKPV